MRRALGPFQSWHSCYAKYCTTVKSRFVSHPLGHYNIYGGYRCLMDAIVLDHVSKKFTLHHDRPRSFQEAFLASVKRENHSAEEFWAMRDVSLTVHCGDTVGLIGPNGAGKSTVLKLVSRIIDPTSGQVTVDGRVGALLELGAGFHPDLTGRENIYLNGSILGLSRARIRQRLDEIIEFAELTRFVDVPVRHYSSGMYVRLGFSVAVHTDPEILLIDETLAVGDQNFQAKCMEKMGELRRRGVTVILVSHDLASVGDFCSHVGWMENGTLKRYDLAGPTISAYLQQASEVERERLEREQDRRHHQPPKPRTNGAIRITQVEWVGPDGQPGWTFQSLQPLRLRLHYETKEPVEAPVFSFLIYRDDGLYVAGANTYDGAQGSLLPPICGKGVVEAEIATPGLAHGRYLLSVGAYVRPDPPFWADPADFHDRAYRFHIQSNEYVHGVLATQARWNLRPVED
ncbi:MAG: Teichoic acids export ATP-binding protein TagH [Chloroflexi bacterium ADurb.Bin180]|nr:MAG: Teichoic acids export ATP-binding protein TagH [Chloroflexi bacterium ADurb.Bin180]